MSITGMSPIEITILTMVAVALLLQACFVLAVVIGMVKVSRTIKQEIADVRTSVMPLVFDTRELLTRLSPKIESSADDISEILKTVRAQSANVGTATSEIVERIRRQSEKVEGMVSGLVDSADRTGSAVAGAVGKPIRRLAALVASAKAVVDTLRSPSPAPRAPRQRDGGDMFV